MSLLTHKEIERLLNDKTDSGIFLDPLLSADQIGAATIDVRLGYDFLVSINTRTPYISLGKDIKRSIGSYFQGTRRDIGDSFMLYPGQLVITTSLEYIRLPKNIYAEVLTRSSYNRLGIRMSTMLQPAFRGCISLEIVNDNNNAVELVVGSRMFQLRLHKIEQDLEYGDYNSRKYYGNVTPSPSRANEDSDLQKLLNLRRED